MSRSQSSNPLLLEPPSAGAPGTAPSAPGPYKPARPWRDKFRDAFRGLKHGIREHSSFFVHFFFATLALCAGLVLGLSLVQWCIVVACIGAVITAELFNSALETLYHVLDERDKARSARALDVAAAAVLTASATAALIGLIVFLHRLLEILDWV